MRTVVWLTWFCLAVFAAYNVVTWDMNNVRQEYGSGQIRQEIEEKVLERYGDDGYEQYMNEEGGFAGTINDICISYAFRPFFLAIVVFYYPYIRWLCSG